MRSSLRLVLVSSFAGVQMVAGAGLDSCPCMTKIPAGAFQPYMVDGVLKYQDYEYPSDYGVGECKAWDESLQPYCTDKTGKAIENRPDWCEAQFCYIDPDNCDLPLQYSSAYFPLSKLSYSFQTCGTKSTFVDWFEDGGASGSHKLTDLIPLMEGYVGSIRNKLQESNVDMGEITTGCDIKSACHCDTCGTVAGWGETEVDFATSVFVPRNGSSSDPKSSCLAGIGDGIFSKIAASEYDDSSRVGSIYQGFQPDGSYSQWPAVEWCPASYDPRFRPWYSISASGPKDVVMLIDQSGSMQAAGRMKLAIAAVEAVLYTLTWQDRVMIIMFNSDIASKSSTELQLVTDEHREELIAWIKGKSPDGGTNFIAPLNEGLDVLTTAADKRCSKVVLFMTDGEAEFSDSDYTTVKNKAIENDITIFGYALGSGANTQVTKRVSCESEGVFHQLSDGADLSSSMSSYFSYFAAATSFTGVRWVSYIDAITNTDLLAACTPMYDFTDTSTEISILMGVVCMDINLMVSVETLKAQPDFPAFWAQVQEDTLKCPAMWGGMSADAKREALELVRGNLRSAGAHKCYSDDGFNSAGPTASFSAFLLLAISTAAFLL